MISHDLVSVFASHAVLRVLGAFLTVGMVKGFLLVLAAWLACRFLWGREPLRAHTIWLVTLMGLVMLPVAWLVLPPMRLGAFPQPAMSTDAAPVIAAPAFLFAPDRLMGLTDTAGGYTALARRSLPGRAPPVSWLLLTAWGCGAAALLFRAAVGRVIVRRSLRGPALPPAAGRAAHDLCRELALPRPVGFSGGPRCAVPYTFGFLHPVVVLPAGAAAWSAARLRPVLLHELAHVQRRDAMSNLLATLVTSLLWWFPPAWVASRFLGRAAELACDRFVLEHGVPAHRYASEMLELSRSSRGNLFASPECSSFGAGGVVRERILSVLKAGMQRKPAARRTAGLAVIGFFCCLLPLMAVTLTGAPAAGTERLVGTWSNTRYFGTYWTHSYTMGRGGKMTWNDFSNDEVPTGEARYLIDRQWEDSQGAAWYFLTAKSSYLPYNEEVAAATISYSLVRVDPSGDRMDMETSLMSWPQEFGALGNFHYVYFREQ
jgi:beta-lactamase regulating signal transducer with metallopeptidase domain